MALPIAQANDILQPDYVADEFVSNLMHYITLFCQEQQQRPVVLVIGYSKRVIHVLKNCHVDKIVVCDPNAVLDDEHVVCIAQHSIRIPTSVRADIVVLNVFNSATVNRWAPVYIMHDLLRRGIVRTFRNRLPYVYPSKSTMTARAYYHPTIAESSTPVSGKIRWKSASPITNSDLLIPACSRVNVLYEQYDHPAQSWPEFVTVECTPIEDAAAIVILEWSIELMPGVLMNYLAPRNSLQVHHAQRLQAIGMDYFVWNETSSKITFCNSPKISGGVNLTVAKETPSKIAEISLSSQKIVLAIERWFGDIVSKDL